METSTANGICKKEKAVVSVYDHALYGDGVFEGIRSYGENVFV